MIHFHYILHSTQRQHVIHTNTADKYFLFELRKTKTKTKCNNNNCSIQKIYNIRLSQNDKQKAYKKLGIKRRRNILYENKKRCVFDAQQVEQLDCISSCKYMCMGCVCRTLYLLFGYDLGLFVQMCQSDFTFSEFSLGVSERRMHWLFQCS